MAPGTVIPASPAATLRAVAAARVARAGMSGPVVATRRQGIAAPSAAPPTPRRTEPQHAWQTDDAHAFKYNCVPL
jgi:hypothetical protein